MSRDPRIAVIDIGTQSVLFLIQPWTRMPVQASLHEAHPVRLGEGLSRHGLIAEPAIQRLTTCLHTLLEKARRLEADRLVAVGTHVFRVAQNGRAVIERIFRETGLFVEVLTEAEEALWSHKGMLWGRGVSTRVMTADIGGGSTELVVGTGEEIEGFLSLPIGAVSLTERFLHANPPTPSERQGLQEAIESALEETLPVTWLPCHRLFAAGGTATTLAAIAMDMRSYDPNRVDGFVLSRRRLAVLTESLFSLPLSERTRMPGLEPGRADILPAGASLLLGFFDRLNLAEVTLCDRGLRHGIVLREADRMGWA